MAVLILFFYCKRKTAYDMRISDWSSDVCSSELAGRGSRAIVDDRARAARQPDRQPARRALSERGRLLSYRWAADGAARGRAWRRLAELVRLRPSLSRTAARRVAKECVSTYRSRWSPSH